MKVSTFFRSGNNSLDRELLFDLINGISVCFCLKIIQQYNHAHFCKVLEKISISFYI